MESNQLSRDQEYLLNNLDAVKQDLLKIPDVLAIGIGFKETNGEFTNEISYRVYVKEKKDLAAISESEIIPAKIDAFKTDVLEPLKIVLDSDVCGDERLAKGKHRPLQAGIAVSTDSTSLGTLGWFGKLDIDDTPVLLTNKHVLYDSTDEVNTTKKKTAQPQLGEKTKCCCCECGSDNVIGETIIGISNKDPLTSTSVDCAIAKINPEHASDISLVITNNSTEQVLTVSGTAAAVVGQTVRKIGARSGFTRGTVIHIGDMAVEPSDPGGGTISVRTGQVLIIPTPTETYQVREGVCKFAFSNSGDSGAVILNDSNEIVALNYGGNRRDYSIGLTIANNIQNVLNAFSDNGFPITLSVSPGGDGDKMLVSAPVLPSMEVKQEHLLAELSEANKASLLYKLTQEHHREILDLINSTRAVTVAWHRNQGSGFCSSGGARSPPRTISDP